MIISPFLYYFIPIKSGIAILLMIPMILDGFIQISTKYESSNLKRFVTGLLFGYALMSLMIITTMMAFEFGIGLSH